MIVFKCFKTSSVKDCNDIPFSLLIKTASYTMSIKKKKTSLDLFPNSKTQKKLAYIGHIQYLLQKSICVKSLNVCRIACVTRSVAFILF